MSRCIYHVPSGVGLLLSFCLSHIIRAKKHKKRQHRNCNKPHRPPAEQSRSLVSLTYPFRASRVCVHVYGTRFAGWLICLVHSIYIQDWMSHRCRLDGYCQHSHRRHHQFGHYPGEAANQTVFAKPQFRQNAFAFFGRKHKFNR